ncbi:type II secretion system protein [Thermus thalpophilus]|uniref:type II secretion system protein n=1 Tax=Thermus thalpophilus TaxID=2908147 RepID=UPI002432BFBC|nr:type II secretion system protein [Thermus thalpophilus]
MRGKGLTIVEVLIALAILGVAFGALLLNQLSSLRTSTRMRLVTEIKSTLSQVLEAQAASIVAKNGASVAPFNFYDYYWGCPSPVANAQSIVGRPLNSVACTGSTTLGRVRVAWTISGEGGIPGEGVILLQAAASIPSLANSPRVTLVKRVSCYDVYPSPTKDAPAPCPTPTASGGGRP